MYDRGMSEAPGLSAEQLGAYFALVEVSSLLQYAVDEHLRIDGDLSQCAVPGRRLVDAPGAMLRMTDLADGVVYGRSGLTCQAGRVRDHMRTAPPRSAKPCARRNLTD
jgi:hypothetical protein